MELKRLEGERHRSGGEISDQEANIDAKLRNWPRSPATDPYLAGFESLAEALRKESQYAVYTAYNEFCDPTIEKAVDRTRAEGVTELLVLTTMVTPGGSHAAQEIPQALELCRRRYPDMTITYAWPFAPAAVARFLADHARQTWSATGEPTQR